MNRPEVGEEFSHSEMREKTGEPARCRVLRVHDESFVYEALGVKHTARLKRWPSIAVSANFSTVAPD